MGIVAFEDAVQRAQENELDLVLVAPQANPPVCRMMNYGKYQYEQNKKHQQAKKKQGKNKVKEVKFHLNTEEHDFNTKVSHIQSFLQKGCKVKVSLFFRGREMAHTDFGYELLEQVRQHISEYGSAESPAKQGRVMSMMISPLSQK